MIPRVLGLAGRAGAGKSTLARHLVARHGFVCVSFAAPLKAMLAALGLDAAELDGDRKELPCRLLGGRTPRHAMRTLGTEWGRDLIDPWLWQYAWTRQVHPILGRGERVVADDVRFPNEVTAIRALGGLVVRLERPGPSVAPSSHPSETTPIEVDLTLNNDRAIEALAERVAWLM